VDRGSGGVMISSFPHLSLTSSCCLTPLHRLLSAMAARRYLLRSRSMVWVVLACRLGIAKVGVVRANFGFQSVAAAPLAVARRPLRLVMGLGSPPAPMQLQRC